MSDVPVSLTVTEKTKLALGDASPWIRFLAILGFIGVGVLVLAGLGLAIFGGVLGAAVGMGFLGPIIGLVYIALAVVLFFPTRTQLRLATQSRLYKTSGDPAALESFAVNVKSLAVFYGVLSIIVLALAALGLIVALFGVLAAKAM